MSMYLEPTDAYPCSLFVGGNSPDTKPAGVLTCGSIYPPCPHLVAWCQKTAKQIILESEKLRSVRVFDASDRIKKRFRSGEAYRRREDAGQLKLF